MRLAVALSGVHPQVAECRSSYGAQRCRAAGRESTAGEPRGSHRMGHRPTALGSQRDPAAGPSGESLGKSGCLAIAARAASRAGSVSMLPA